jgi:hypothetical protein
MCDLGEAIMVFWQPKWIIRGNSCRSDWQQRWMAGSFSRRLRGFFAPFPPYRINCDRNGAGHQ